METTVRYKGMSLTARQKVRRFLAESGGIPGRADIDLWPKNEATLRAYSMQESHPLLSRLGFDIGAQSFADDVGKVRAFRLGFGLGRIPQPVFDADCAVSGSLAHAAYATSRMPLKNISPSNALVTPASIISPRNPANCQGLIFSMW